MANSFTDQQVTNAVYGYEKVPYTFLGTLATGRTNIATIQNVATASNGEKMAILGDLAPDTASKTQLVVGTVGRTRQMSADAFPGTLTPINTYAGNGFRSTGILSLYALNNGTASITGYGLNYTGTVKPLTTADKLLRGLALTPEDHRLAVKYGLSNNGKYPLSMENSLRDTFYNQVIQEDVFAFTQDTSAGSPTPVETEFVNEQEVLIITKLSASGTTGQGLTLTINRDTNLTYVSLAVDNMTSQTFEDVWIPATSQLVFQLTSTTALTSVNVLMTVLRVHRSPIVKAKMNLLNPHGLTGVEAELYDQARAGVI